RTREGSDAEDQDFEERLHQALRHGQFLVLTVRPSCLSRFEEVLVNQFPVRRMSLDALFLKHLKQKARELRIDWRGGLRAGAGPRSSRDWQNLERLVGRAVAGVEAELLGSPEPVLLVHPGLLARYQQMGLVERLRDQVGRPGKCPGLWLLVPGDEQRQLPLL